MLAIDFSQPPEKIVASLTELLQEGVDTRWRRRQGAEEDEDAGD
ncbi:hypothetical protein [Streptomyces sp. AVP053U2]|nr:hypothetical protein [Streptomyces sp. AVP053U2]